MNGILYLFQLCFLWCYSFCYSKTKNQQRILSVQCRNEKEKREQTEKNPYETSKRMQKDRRVHGLYR